MSADEKLSLRDRFTDWATEKFLGATAQFLKSKKGQKILQKFASSPAAEEAGKKLLVAAGKNIIGEQAMDLFQKGPLSNLLVKLLSDENGGDSLGNSLLHLLSQGEEEDDGGAIFRFLQSESGEQILERVKKMGAGAGKQVLGGLSDSAYREWVLQNPPPAHPDVMRIPHTIDIESNDNPDYKKCANCDNNIESKPCPHCQTTNEPIGYKTVENPEWNSQKRKLDEWQEKSTQKKEELGITDDDVGAKEIGTAIALTMGGMETLSISDLLTQITGQKLSAEAREIVARSLRGSESRHQTTENYDDFRLKDMTPQKAWQALKENAQDKVEVDKHEIYEGSILTEKIYIGDNSTIEGTVVCTQECWVKGVRNMTIHGDLVIIGKLKGFKAPQVAGTIYLVKDKEVGVSGKVSQRNLRVVECTIDRAYERQSL